MKGSDLNHIALTSFLKFLRVHYEDIKNSKEISEIVCQISSNCENDLDAELLLQVSPMRHVEDMKLEVENASLSPLDDRVPSTPCNQSRRLMDLERREFWKTTDKVLESSSLKIIHKCKNIACRDVACSLCSQSMSKCCLADFCPKYTVGECLAAGCGANVFLEWKHSCGNLDVEADFVLGLLDSSSNLVQQGNIQMSEALLLELVKTTSRGAPMLSHKNLKSVDGVLRVPMNGSALLNISGVIVHGSSEAVLKRRAGKFVLFCLVEFQLKEGYPKQSTAAVLSTPFSIVSTRSKSGMKKAILHERDDLCKVNGLGKESIKKISYLRMKNDVSLLEGLPFDYIRNVGELRQLFRWLHKRPNKQLKFRRNLKIGKAWDIAKDHALNAVSDDFRTRLWMDEALAVGLAFGCSKGSVPDLESPIAFLMGEDDYFRDYKAAHIDWLTDRHDMSVHGASMQQVFQTKTKAIASWFKTGHPGWITIPIDTQDFKHLLFRQGIVNIRLPVLH